MHDAVPLLQDYLRHAAQRKPSKIALVCAERQVSYVDLASHAARLARALQRRGLERGDRVVIFAPNGIEAVTAFWGVLEAGAVVVMVNPLTKPEKLALLLNDCEPTALVIDGALTTTFAAAAALAPSLRTVLITGTCEPVHLEGVSAVVSADVAVAQETSGEPPARQSIDIDLATIMYTSGSCGEPKGVMLTHRNMLTAASSVVEYLDLVGDDVIVNVLPLAFDYGLYQMIMSVRQCARLVLERSFGFPTEFLNLLRKEHVTVVPGVPTLFALLTRFSERPIEGISTVRTVTSTAAPFPTSQLPPLRAMFPAARFFSMYGLTECKRCTYLPPEDLDRKPDSVGIAIPNTELWLVDDDGQRLGANQVGELVVRGATVMQGYWGDPGATGRTLRPGPLPGERVLYTGDLCRFDDESYLYVVGRKDQVFKSRGEKVAPAAIEAVLLAVSGVREAAVVGVPDELLGNAIKAFVVLEEGSNLDENALRRVCQKRLESVLIPTVIQFVDSLPTTDNGKIKKQDLVV
jgi:acyl-CoA synthetase (AMP-forming)/AMP-acid ligase II